MVLCAVVGCKSKYGRQTDVHMYGVPSIITNQCDKTRELSTKRKALWLARINRPELYHRINTRDIKVCNHHFVDGKPSRLFENTHYDWAPSRNLGYNKKLCEPKTVAAAVARHTRADHRRKRRQEIVVLPDVRRKRKKLQNCVTQASEDNHFDTQDISNSDHGDPQVGLLQASTCDSNSDHGDPQVGLLQASTCDLNSDHGDPQVGLLQASTCDSNSDRGDPQVGLLQASTCDFTTSDEHKHGDYLNENEPVSTCQTDLTGLELDQIIVKYQCLTKENAELKADLWEKQMSHLVLTDQNESLVKDNVALRSEVSSLKSEVKRLSLSQEILENDDVKVKFYTGLPTFTLLTHVFNLVGSKIKHSHRNALPKFTEFLMVMMKLRLGLLEQDLAYRFGVAQSTVSIVCDKWIRMMAAILSPLIIWPERHVLHKTMPDCFKKAFGDKVAVIIDCFEMSIDGPSSLVTRSETWSQYKHRNTVKYLIGLTPQGTVCFISCGWGGRVSDKTITFSSDFLDKLTPGDIVLPDRGFDIADDVGLYQANLAIPAFTKGKAQLSCNEVNETGNIATVRAHIEKVIGYVRRKFRILSGFIPYSYLTPRIKDDNPPIDHIVQVCCSLVNFCPPITSVSNTDNESQIE